MKIASPFHKKTEVQEDISSELFKASRRDFLKIGGVLAGGLVLGVSFFSCNEKGKEGASLAPNVSLTINSDGEVLIVAPPSAMGTGSRPALPLIVADELGAD